MLSKHGYGDVSFDYVVGDLASYTARIDFKGRQHKIEVYEDGPVMLSGEQLFEPYLREEFDSEEALREGFATRLDRYLGGGEWEGPDEPSLWESVKLSLRRLFGRR